MGDLALPHGRWKNTLDKYIRAHTNTGFSVGVRRREQGKKEGRVKSDYRQGLG